MTPVYDHHRITGWLLAPAAFILMTFFAVCAMVVMYSIKLYQIVTTIENWSSYIPLDWCLSFLITVVMALFTAHILKLMFIRSKHFPRRFIIWLLVLLLLGLKTFAFAAVEDDIALKTLAWPLIGAGVFVPYIKNSARVKMTFTQDR
ncbi:MULTISPECIES: DUF2569 domain-containing protein [Providencia]|uniref:DUF2569 domain-containing protein n=1 Tax=Providencia stuartii TaxID=588 RepID=A0AAI9HZ34_PROST|nr:MULTISPECIES: DUF2569 domain-containing protein [Providencia]ELR5043620.1 DUF2569 domain-containing protein [Providencia rettgeri]ELR5035627.1 DUF2569 domain-containing protein [Providencia stuartii]ELR5119882.1 DUF2569 domain-containing protein [Providencia stuartii]ELR5290983.1 DUF2569 domain-containing protein [Providencia stuartii]MCR4182305.1 DUF2569 domain-containing protein [Providencia vermicola]